MNHQSGKTNVNNDKRSSASHANPLPCDCETRDRGNLPRAAHYDDCPAASTPRVSPWVTGDVPWREFKVTTFKTGDRPYECTFYPGTYYHFMARKDANCPSKWESVAEMCDSKEEADFVEKAVAYYTAAIEAGTVKP